MAGYVKIMAWYAVYLIAFGIGFYIMLHNDIKKVKLSQDNSTRFDNPLLSLMKTSTMFVGELDFDDLKMRGGDVSVSMGYIFLLVFIFLMVVVLMNVLNGLAVTDTGKMIKESVIESQISTIENMRYFENVYLDIGQSVQDLEIPCLNKILSIPTMLGIDIVPNKVFLFGSKYVNNSNQLSLPLKQPTS
jgi:hypothetical protein